MKLILKHMTLEEQNLTREVHINVKPQSLIAFLRRYGVIDIVFSEISNEIIATVADPIAVKEHLQTVKLIN